MAKLKITDLGSSVCVDHQNEKLVPALGDGTFGIPGDLCYVVETNGRIAGADIDAAEFFVGILMESKLTGTEDIIGQDVPCTLVVPKSGHNYRIRINVADDDDEVGAPVTFSDTAGKAETTQSVALTLILGFIGNIALEVLTGDSVAEITWK